MSLNYAGFKPLIKERGDEPFRIHHQDWNSVSSFLWSYLGWISPGNPNIKQVRHAWKMVVRWDFTISRWVFSVNPGFVRGHEVFVKTPPGLVPEIAREKLGLKVESETNLATKVDVSLLHRPEVFIPTKLWRPVAVDTGASASIAGKQVPRSIQEQYNTVVSGKLNATEEQAETGAKTDVSASLEQDRETARVAYCVEVVLRQPRASVGFALPTESSDPTYLELMVMMVDPKKDPPYLEVIRESPEELEAQQSVTVKAALEGSDPGYDTRPIATIWMLGPVGELDAAEVNEQWTPVVQYHTFYNLDHTVQIDVNKIPPLRQLNPAAGLLSGVAVQAAVEIVNETNRQAEQAYQSTSIIGRFWTV